MIVITQLFPLLAILPSVCRSAVAAETCKHNGNDADLKFYRLMLVIFRHENILYKYLLISGSRGSRRA